MQRRQLSGLSKGSLVNSKKRFYSEDNGLIKSIDLLVSAATKNDNVKEGPSLIEERQKEQGTLKKAIILDGFVYLKPKEENKVSEDSTIKLSYKSRSSAQLIKPLAKNSK